MAEKFKLIDGVFSVKEAREIVGTLLESKIQFHNKQSFSSEIRKGFKDVPSLIRQESLKNTKQDFLKYLSTFADEDHITMFAEIKVQK